MDNQGPFAGAENPYRSSSSSTTTKAVDAAGQKASFAANKAQYEDQEWLQR